MKNKTLRLEKDTDMNWRSLELTLHEKYHVHAVVLGKNGARRTQGDIMWANSLCSAVKATPQGETNVWSMTQKQMCCDADQKKCCVREECPVGMTKIVVPVMVKEHVAGFICLGGRPFVSTNRLYTDRIQRMIGGSRKEIQDYLQTVEPIDYRTIKEILTCICGYHGHIR